MRISRCLTVFLLLAWCLNAAAQSPVNMKFGKPTKEEMEMTVYSPDDNACAVVLCRLTDVEYTVQHNGYLVDYHEKFRIKVLKPEGVRYANVTIPYSVIKSSKSYLRGQKFSQMAGDMDLGTSTSSFLEDAVSNYTTESVVDLKATAFNQENGKTVKSTLKKNAVSTKQIDDEHYEMTFTIPDVRQGTVIEYEYTIHSELFYLLHDWYAQWDIPVAYARLDMEIPSYLLFNVEEQGIQRLTCTCTQGTMHYKLESDAIARPISIPTNHYTCVGRDLAAMPKDSYVWNEHDHYAGVIAELKKYSVQGLLPMDYAKTWDQIDNMILDDEDLGKHLNDHSPLRKELETAGIPAIANERDRAMAVFQQVMSRVKWDGTYRLWPRLTSETLKEGKGSNADINLLLIQSLQDVGLNAAPVVLRTRTEGKIPYNFPSIRKLSTFIVGITPQSGMNTYIDASCTDGYLDILPEPLLVERARLVGKGKKGTWVNLQKLSRAQTSTVVEAVLSTDGKLSGTQTTRYTGLAAAKYHQRVRANGGEPAFEPEATETVEFNRQGTVSDGTISICPLPTPPLTSNPFTAEKRLVPVEFPCIQSDVVVVNITLPEGYTLSEEPQLTSVSTTDKGIDGRYFTSMTDGKLQLKYQLDVNKISHSEKNYADLRHIFDIFTQYSTKPLVFKKK